MGPIAPSGRLAVTARNGERGDDQLRDARDVDAMRRQEQLAWGAALVTDILGAGP